MGVRIEVYAVDLAPFKQFLGWTVRDWLKYYVAHSDVDGMGTWIRVDGGNARGEKRGQIYF